MIPYFFFVNEHLTDTKISTINNDIAHFLVCHKHDKLIQP